jgi:hypothetical protein
VRVVPVPTALADLLKQHLRKYGTAPDGRLFRGARDGMLSESTYGRVWRAALEIALGPELAATPLARRPHDLRHAALSLWLNATGAPTEVPPARVTACMSWKASTRTASTARTSSSASGSKTPSTRTPHGSPCVTASGYTHRRYRHDPVRHMSVNNPSGLGMAHRRPGSPAPVVSRRRLPG